MDVNTDYGKRISFAWLHALDLILTLLKGKYNNYKLIVHTSTFDFPQAEDAEKERQAQELEKQREREVPAGGSKYQNCLHVVFGPFTEDW